MNFRTFLKDRKILAIAVLAVLHLVGIVGLNSVWKDYFVALTALNLFVTASILLPFAECSRTQLFTFFILAFSIGMFFEIIGVGTGFPFGTYHYSNILSFKLLGVPIIIGVNWFLLSYGIIAALNRWIGKLNYVLKVFLAALAMTFMDVLIEPFAIYHRLWVWESNEVPLQNYLSWFFISFLLFAIGFKIVKDDKNQVAAMSLCILLVFFVLNNFYL